MQNTQEQNPTKRQHWSQTNKQTKKRSRSRTQKKPARTRRNGKTGEESRNGEWRDQGSGSADLMKLGS